MAYLVSMKISLRFVASLTLFSLFSFFEADAQIIFDIPDLEEVWDRADKEGQFLGKYLTGVVLEDEFDFFEMASVEDHVQHLTDMGLR